MEHEVLKRTEAADLLRINAEVLRRLSEKGEVPGAFKVGGQWRYRRVDLLRWGDNHESSQ